MLVENVNETEIKEEKIKGLAEDDQKSVGHNNQLPQHGIKTYIQSMATALKTSKKVIANTALRSETWTKSCYDLLSKLIIEDLNKNMSKEMKLAMGTSLSSKTLQKIVNLTYNVSFPIDPRTLNTLHKVSIFLGYKNWEGFVQDIDTSMKKELEDIDPEEELKRIIEEAVHREHLVYCNLPEVQEEHLTDYFIKESPSYNMIMDVLMEKSAKKQIISNNYNPSTCEILDMEVKKLKGDYAQVYTKEFWLLCWWDMNTKKYIKRYKDISGHFYILTRLNNKWAIKTKASTSDPMELG